jgi:hypothetical protein
VQFVLWNAIVVVSKTLLFEIEILLSGLLISISTLLLGWIQPYETLELILVIIIAPVIMNGLAFWFQDNFLKKKENLERDTSEVPKENEEVRTSANTDQVKPDVH